VGTRGERCADSLRERTRYEGFVTKNEAARLRLGSIDDDRGQCREMIGATLDRECPLSLAPAQIRRHQQFRKRHDSGQRCPDVVRDTGKRSLDCARRRCLSRGYDAARTASPRRFFPDLRH
jgi:hypothetical protein